MKKLKSPPTVLCFSGNDPTGGAGIQADIETLASLDCHCIPVITALTAQNTTNLTDLFPVSPEMILAQTEQVLDDIPVLAFKIGLLADDESAKAVADIIIRYPEIPVIFDPVLAAGGGASWLDDALLDVIVNEILPESSIVTPNSLEARILAGGIDDIDSCGYQILDLGASYALITGSHEQTPVVHNTLYSNEADPVTCTWERLPAMYHGSGCTLASAIAGLLAQGLSMEDACMEAQEFAWNSLAYGVSLGQGQLLPNRFFWSRGENESNDE